MIKWVLQLNVTGVQNMDNYWFIESYQDFIKITKLTSRKIIRNRGASLGIINIQFAIEFTIYL